MFDWLDEYEECDDGEDLEPDVCDIEMGYEPFPD
jgi:hypothetical protein